MVDAIVTAVVVFTVFAVVASLLVVYIWLADPRQFAVWRASLRPRRKPAAPDTGRVPAPEAPVAALATGKSAPARLQYWLDTVRDSRPAR